MDEIKVCETDQIVNIVESEELKVLEDMVFENPSHNQIRDVFLFQTYTGARYSDIHIIKRCDLKKDGGMNVWEYIDEKTGSNIVAPITDKAKRILEKYQLLDTQLPRFTNQTMNKELKEIAKLVQFNRTIKTIDYSDNVKTETISPLHENISTHMARKSFISLSIQMGVPERMVREVSGHKDERSFRRYVNLCKTHLVTVSEAWNKKDKE
jgi:integrase